MLTLLKLNDYWLATFHLIIYLSTSAPGSFPKGPVILCMELEDVSERGWRGWPLPTPKQLLMSMRVALFLYFIKGRLMSKDGQNIPQYPTQSKRSISISHYDYWNQHTSNSNTYILKRLCYSAKLSTINSSWIPHFQCSRILAWQRLESSSQGRKKKNMPQVDLQMSQ